MKKVKKNMEVPKHVKEEETKEIKPKKESSKVRKTKK